MDNNKFEFDYFDSAPTTHCDIKDRIRELSIVLSKAHRWQQISKAKFSKRYLGKANQSLLHFQRIANYLENINSQEAKKRGSNCIDWKNKTSRGKKKRFFTLQDAKKVVKVVQKCPN